MSLKKVIVYGGRGALGAECVKKFKSNNYWVGSIDMHENSEADACVVVNVDQSWAEQEKHISEGVKNIVGGDKVDAIICVAGGWAGGNASHKDFIQNADLMWKQSVWSSTIAASLGAKFLKEGGLLTLTGAHAALEGTPGMIGYGMAKAAVHQLTKSLAKSDGGLPPNCHALAVLPVTLDTPNNRKWMPKADTSSWTPLEFISQMFLQWTENGERPPSGSLVSLITSKNETTTIFK